MNVLIIMSDQHNKRYLGCMGHPVVETPRMDALAAQGVRFNAAYCPSPLCGPSRMSFLTGLYSYGTGVYANGQALASDVPTFAHGFGGGGYDTALIGRMHIVGDDEKHGFEEKLGRDVTAGTIGGGLAPRLEGLPAGMGVAGLKLSGPGDSAYQHYDDEVTDIAVQWLRARTAGRPWMATVGYALPHNPFVCSPEDYARYEGLVELPELAPEELAALPADLRRLYLAVDTGEVTRADALRALTAYCGSVTATDRRVGRLLDALEQTGAAGDTLVVYTSDHGEAAGEHGLWYKTTMYEGSAGVPLILRLPGRLPAGRVCDEAVNLIDIGPTALDLAGLPPLPAIHGRSLRPLWEGRASEWDNATFSEYGTRYGRAHLSRMVRAGRWKYVYYHDGLEQLFDMQADPWERADLSARPEHRAEKARLRALALRDWDPGQICRCLDLWKQRNATIYGWYASRPRPDGTMYEGPPGCNRLDAVPFTPRPNGTRGGSY